MKFFIFFFLLFGSIKNIQASTILGQIQCGTYKNAYINGILNKNRADAKESANLLEDKLGLKKNSINVIFNESGGLSKDLIDSLELKLEEVKRNGNWIDYGIASLFVKSKKAALLNNEKTIINDIKNHAKTNSFYFLIVKETYTQTQPVRSYGIAS